MSVTDYAICPYCGQTKMIETSTKLDEGELRRAIARTCGCDGALRVRNQETALETIEHLCGAEAGDFGFKPLGEIAVNALAHLAYAIHDEEITQATVAARGDKVKLTIKGGKVTIERKSEKKVEL